MKISLESWIAALSRSIEWQGGRRRKKAKKAMARTAQRCLRFEPLETRNLLTGIVVEEGETAFNNGDVPGTVDPSAFLSASVGDVFDNQDGTWNWSFDTADGPDESQEVIIYADEVEIAIFELTVENLDPELFDVFGSTINEGEEATVSGDYSDVGFDDAHTVDIDWGDGTVETELAVSGGSLSFTHVYPPDEQADVASEDYTVTITLYDDDGGTMIETTTVTIDNADPELFNLAGSTIVEGDTATVSGDYSDVGISDTHTVDIDWGDGTVEIGLAVSGGAFSFTHTYEDDDPTGASSDDYIVAITLNDDDGGSVSDEATVTVDNADPVLSNLAVDATSIDEGNAVTLSGDYSDVGASDTHTVDIDWGDGTIDAGLTVSGGSFSFTHVYEDDDPSDSSSDDYTVTVTLYDDDEGEASDSTTVTVNNVNPVLSSFVVDPTTITEGGAVTLDGDFSDVGANDTHTVDIDWGDGTVETGLAVSGGNFSFTHVYEDDDPTATSSDDYTVTVTLYDDDGGTDSASATVTVDNADPELSNVTGSTADEGDEATISGDYSDAGSNDTHTVDIDWGDGTIDTGLTVSGGSFSFTHVYEDDDPTATSSDDYTVTITLHDDDGGSASASTTVTINNVDPELTSVDGSTVEEGEAAIVSVDYDDVGIHDTHTVDIDWGDGTVQTGVAVGGGGFAATHVYPDNEAGVASQDYTVTITLHDDDGGTASAIATVYIDVTNFVPTGFDDEYWALDGEELTVSTGDGVLANDYDDDGDPLTAVLVSGPSNAEFFSFSDDGSFVYDPIDGIDGSDSFVYQPFDGIALGQATTVTIHYGRLVIQFQSGAGEDWHNVSGTPTDVWVGEQINLRTVFVGVGAMPPITSHQWSIPGKAIKDYKASTASASVEPITQAMKDSSEINFYWTDGAAGRTVFDAVEVGNWTYIRSASFNVQRPSVTVTAVTTAVGIESHAGDDWLRFGDLAVAPQIKGIEFTRSTSTAGGDFTWTQTASQDIHNVSAQGTDVRKMADGKLDGSVIYPANPNSPLTTNDSPGSRLASALRFAQREDTFSMYLMWKSPVAESIRVPLRRVDWAWGFVADSEDGVTWNILSSHHTVNPADQDATDPPVWDGLIQDVEWIIGD